MGCFLCAYERSHLPQGTIFEKRAAHGYFLLAAAGSTVHQPEWVRANYGLDECRFYPPIYRNDTIQVRLTCKEKVERDPKGKEHPSGVVKWYEEIFDQNGELVAMATILTLVQKKSPFPEINRKYLEEKFDALTENTKSSWGLMTAQHMVEHFEFFINMALGKVPCEIVTPADRVEKFQESLWNYFPMPKSFDHPVLKKGETEELNHANLVEAKKAFFAAYDELELFFKNNPNATVPNPVFGNLDAYDWYLLSRKHFAHHFEQFGI
ncbi:MAG: MaoC/PaaZ C-terminal domain-containing protein [Saprospiraceae bacterium]